MDFILIYSIFVCLATMCSAQCPYKEHPVVLTQNTNATCVTVPYGKPTHKTYFSDKRFQLCCSRTAFYPALSGFLNFTDNTPQYCIDETKGSNFSINMYNYITTKRRARVELVSCRSNGFLRNSKDVCSPQECSRYLNRSKKHMIFRFRVELNMNDINALNISRRVRILSFNSPSDPRFILNITSNKTKLLETKDFLALCSLYGPCKSGRFLQRDDILYAKGGYSSLTMQKDGRTNTIFLLLRHDQRPFVTTAKDDPCSIRMDMNSSICTSSFGTQSYQKLWEKPLPLSKEWLRLGFEIYFSYENNCTVNMNDLDSYEYLVRFIGPCGRYADMKRGNFPFERIGIYTNSLQAPFKMRYRNIFLQHMI